MTELTQYQIDGMLATAAMCIFGLFLLLMMLNVALRGFDQPHYDYPWVVIRKARAARRNRQADFALVG